MRWTKEEKSTWCLLAWVQHDVTLNQFQGWLEGSERTEMDMDVCAYLSYLSIVGAGGIQSVRHPTHCFVDMCYGDRHD